MPRWASVHQLGDVIFILIFYCIDLERHELIWLQCLKRQSCIILIYLQVNHKVCHNQRQIFHSMVQEIDQTNISMRLAEVVCLCSEYSAKL